MEGQRPLVDPSRSQTPALHTHCVEADTDRDPGGAEEAARNQKPLLFHLCLDLAKICFFTCYFLSWWFLCMASAMPRAASNRAPHTAPGPHPAENRAEENGSSVQSQPVQLYNSLTAPSHFLPVKCHSWNVHSPIPIAWILWFSQPDIMHQDKHSALQMLNYTVTIPRCPPISDPDWPSSSAGIRRFVLPLSRPPPSGAGQWSRGQVPLSVALLAPPTPPPAASASPSSDPDVSPVSSCQISRPMGLGGSDWAVDHQTTGGRQRRKEASSRFPHWR